MTDQSSPDKPPAGSGFFAAPLERHGTAPVAIRIAFWLLIAGGALTVLELVVLVVRSDLLAYGSKGAILIAPLVGGLVGIALRVYVSFAILRGYAPARIYLTVVTGLVIAIAIANRFDPVDALVLASMIACIVLVWLPQSNRYFASATAARKSKLI